MSEMGKRQLRSAAELRQRIAADWCPAKPEHNDMAATHWFRRYNVCASCGRVERLRRAV